MSKVVNLWNYLSDREIHRLREEIVSSVGAKRLVAEDHDYLMDLALSEILENFRLIAKSVVWLGRKCKDPPFLLFERFVNDPVGYNLEWFGWQYRLKKMERKVKEMEKFVAATMQLSQELEVLAEFEQTLRRLQANADSDHVKLLNFQKRVTWQRQEGSSNSKQRNPDCLPQSHSFSALMQSSIHPSEDILQEHLVRLQVGLLRKCMMSGSDSPVLLTCNSVVGGSFRLTSDYMKKLDLMEKSNMESLSSSTRFYSKLALFNSKQGLLKAPSSTLHYANVIILIENLASSSHMIDLETRDDLYRMLPTTVRAALKTRLKACAKSQAPFVYDASLAAEWNLALSQILIFRSSKGRFCFPLSSLAIFAPSAPPICSARTVCDVRSFEM
ncbi:hypothetical protein OIU85_016531 [Salix viminalis]|uniref:DUF668 domain-containing protein n=1 Tax=Salix viminalis TaxID=40686 RepID=A0A9Q0V672_SALVM|nr:hypothetical protein OIU85_016531 [Salix viminalis]